MLTWKENFFHSLHGSVFIVARLVIQITHSSCSDVDGSSSVCSNFAKSFSYSLRTGDDEIKKKK